MLAFLLKFLRLYPDWYGLYAEITLKEMNSKFLD